MLSLHISDVQIILNSLRGHHLSMKSCFEVLQAMDDRRLCVVEAQYHSVQWKYDEGDWHVYLLISCDVL